jgi:acyl dehydratase
MTRKIPGYSFDSLPTFAGRELGVGDWTAVDQARIQQFADCTGDHQWIHVDVERARRESPFGTTIAHGFLTLSLLAREILELGVVPSDASRAINSGVNNVRFKTPVRAGARVRARVNLAAAEAKGPERQLLTAACTLEVEGEKDPALTADVVVMVFR